MIHRMLDRPLALESHTLPSTLRVNWKLAQQTVQLRDYFSVA